MFGMEKMFINAAASVAGERHRIDFPPQAHLNFGHPRGCAEGPLREQKMWDQGWNPGMVWVGRNLKPHPGHGHFQG